MSTASDREGHLFLSLLQARVGTSVISRLGNAPPAGVAGMPSGELAARAGLSERATRAFEQLGREFEPGAILGRLAERGIETRTLADEGYPERLREIPDPPPALFVDGEVPEGHPVAVVGSRKASVTGLETARGLGRALAERGVCVVSGLALGIDAAAHEGALEAGGATVGVLGCGIDVVYPGRNRKLFERVKGNGAILSEYYLGEAPLAWRFPARNRIIAGLSAVVVVVEAAERSGALITARHGLETGRDVWAAPGPVGVPESRGSNRLLADGAGVLWDVREFVEAIAPRPAEAPARGAAVPPELREIEAAVFGGVGFEPTETDVVAGRSGVEMRELLPALAMLELKGYVTRDPSGAFVRKPAP